MFSEYILSFIQLRQAEVEKHGIQSIRVSGKIPLISFLCDVHQGLTSSTIPAVSRLAPPPLPRLVVSGPRPQRKYLRGLFTYEL